jgi:hypothetical protein
MLQLLVRFHLFTQQAASTVRTRLSADRGQSTAEYALVLLGAAAVALLLVAWATDSNRIGELLDSVLDRVLDQVP